MTLLTMTSLACLLVDRHVVWVQVCHTGGLWDYLPSFLQRAASPIVELLIDDARGALYARTANSEVRFRDSFRVPSLLLSIYVAMPMGPSQLSPGAAGVS